jgi:hypothetical protein
MLFIATKILDMLFIAIKILDILFITAKISGMDFITPKICGMVFITVQNLWPVSEYFISKNTDLLKSKDLKWCYKQQIKFLEQLFIICKTKKKIIMFGIRFEHTGCETLFLL